jgi:hypothetical protein
MSKTPTTDRKTYNLNRAVEAAFRALDKCRHTAAMIGKPIKSLSMSVDEEGDSICRVRYFRIPKTKAELASLRS